MTTISSKQHRRRKAFTAITLAAALASGLIACSSAEPEPTSGPDVPGAFEDASGEITLYSALSQELTDSAVAQFTELYPSVTVNALRLASGDLTTRFEAEWGAGAPVADIFIGSQANFAEKMYELGAFARTDEELVPAWGNLPESARSEYYGVTDSTPVSITYNTDMVGDDVPSVWADLIDPKWKGNVLMPDPRNTEAWLATLLLFEQTFGEEWLEDFSALDPQLVQSSVPGAQQVAAGEFALQFPSAVTMTPALEKQGAPISNALPTDLSTGIEHYLSVTSTGAEKVAARAFADWALSPAGLEVLSKGLYSPLPGVPGTIELPEGYVTLPMDQVAANKARILAVLGL